MLKEISYKENKHSNSIHISFSEFSLYSQCGHKHLIEKYLKLVEPTTSIHLIFGNAIHSAIEAGLKNKITIENRIIHFKNNFVKGMMDALKDSPEYKQTDEFVLQGENILRLLSTEKIIEKYELISVEEPLYEKMYEVYHFKGFIDLVLRNRENGRILIIDWKTSTDMWDVSKKKKNETFLAQMRLYKYFYGRKFDVSFDMIDCKYIVLNRLKSKKCPELGFGSIQPVEIFSSNEDIEKSLKLVGETIKNIHIDKFFPKAKLNNRKDSCFFCPYKNNPTLCNDNHEQYKYMLAESNK